jgi:hypothetical protein
MRMVEPATCNKRTLIRSRVRDIDRTAEAASPFLIGRAKRCGEKFSETGDGCHDQDIMKHESDMQQKVIFPVRDGRSGPRVCDFCERERIWSNFESRSRGETELAMKVSCVCNLIWIRASVDV